MTPDDTSLANEAERQAYRHRLEAFLASRDAAYELTYESLRTGIRLHSVIEAAAAVADFADQALSIINDEFRPRLECGEGCWYCCSKPGVLISFPELVRILAHVQSSFDAADLGTLRNAARQYAAALHGRSFDAATAASVPCPLLVNGRCSVYEVRPLVCRGYNSTSASACRRAHADVTAMVPLFSVLKDCTDGASVGVSQRLRAEGINDAMIDLGTALSIALVEDASFVTAMVEDNSALLPAENREWATDLWQRVHETARQLGLA